LHDVGKIGVPNRILRKPGTLTDDEFAIIQRHVELSEALLTVLTNDVELVDAVRYHHERWDGLGYPRGVAGETVPLLGRIMIIADAVSAMGMDRPYRKGMSWEAIAQELEHGAGRQFDPELVGPTLRSLGTHVREAQAVPLNLESLSRPQRRRAG
jgi:HD-GYP domain-containing protein (c-di-GMP phosphodiesterase class II)